MASFERQRNTWPRPVGGSWAALLDLRVTRIAVAARPSRRPGGWGRDKTPRCCHARASFLPCCNCAHPGSGWSGSFAGRRQKSPGRETIARAHRRSPTLESVRDAKVQKALMPPAPSTPGWDTHPHASCGRPYICFATRTRDFKARTGPLKDDERTKLGEIYTQSETATGLKTDHRSHERVTFLLPEKLIDNAAQPTDRGNEVEYRETNMAAPSAFCDCPWHKLPDRALQERTLGNDPRRLERRVYKDPYLAPDEFRVLGEVTRQSDDDPAATDSYSFYNQALTEGGQLKAFLCVTLCRGRRSSLERPISILPPIVEARAPEMDSQKRDQNVWQLLMRAVTNLIASNFPNQNGWKRREHQGLPAEQRSRGRRYPHSVRHRPEVLQGRIRVAEGRRTRRRLTPTRCSPMSGAGSCIWDAPTSVRRRNGGDWSNYIPRVPHHRTCTARIPTIFGDRASA